MPYDAREIANYFLDLADNQGRQISNLALQKLVYFAHVSYLLKFLKPLTDDRFEAWEHGPVISDLYHQFKEFKDQPIKCRASKIDFTTGERVTVTYGFQDKEIQILRDTYRTYGHLSPYQLSILSHEYDGPWYRVWHEKEGKRNLGLFIRDELILRVYAERAIM